MAAVGNESPSGDKDLVMQDLQSQLSTAKISIPQLSTLSQKGEERVGVGRQG